MDQKISVVIPNYNGKRLLEKNLPFIIKTCRDAEIIIVDDASEDDSVKLIKNKYPQIKLIEKVTHHGFATSVNLGVKAVSNDLFLLLNTDVVPKTGFLSPLIKHFTDEKVFAVGCMDESHEKGVIVYRGRGIGKFNRGFLVHGRGEIDKTNTLWVTGGSSMFRKSIWEKLSGMDVIYDPFYWEDIDLSYRALKSGYKIYFEPKSIVEHRHEEGAIKVHYSKKEIMKIAVRNQIIFTWKNITDTLYLMQHLVWLPYYLIKSIIKMDWIFVKGFISALRSLSQTINNRNHHKTLFIKSDKSILDQYAQ